MRARDGIAADPRRAPSRAVVLVGRRYSRFVALAKRVLPAIAAALILTVAAWSRIQAVVDGFHVGAPRLDLSDARSLQMVSARYTGVDRDNRPFVITAAVAREQPKLNDLITLHRPTGDMTTAGGVGLELSANTGFYQPDPQLLDLFGNVALYQNKGNEFHSASAHVNMAAGTAEGDQPISGQGPFGNITADGFRILDRGATIVFRGHAKLEILPPAKERQ